LSLLRHLIVPRPRALAIIELIGAVMAGLLWHGGTSGTAPSASADPAYGNVKPNPQNGFVIEGHKFNIQVSFTTCTNPQNTSCRLGAYDVKLQYDPTRLTYLPTEGYVGSSGTSTTIKVNTANWKINQFAGSRVTINGGAGFGNSRIVASNTVNTITVTSPWNPPPASQPGLGSIFIVGGMTDGGWLSSTGRNWQCLDPDFGSNWMDMHCVTYQNTPLGPTGTGNLVNVTMQAGFVRGVSSVQLLTPATRVLRIDGFVIPADILNGSRRVILCPDVNADNNINAIDLGLTAASFGKTTGQPGYSVQRDPDENGNINAIDLSIIAAVFGRKCTQA
jgi:hypothetical protein